MGEDEVHLWRIQPSASDAEELSPGERLRYERMAHGEVREDFAASQAGLRRVLAGYCECAPHDIRFERQARGKPYLEGGPEFNLSHTGGGIFLAVSRHSIGLDVERRSRVVSAVALAEKFFSQEEQARIVDRDAETARVNFLRHWVCKEAMVKLSGDGIYHGLRDAVVGEGGRGAYRGKEVWLELLELPGGYFAAVAAWRPFCVKFFFPT